MRKRFLCLAYCGLILSASIMAQETLDATLQQQVKQISATIKNDPEGAQKAFDGLLKGKNKKNIPLLVAIGQAYLESGKTAEAHTYADKAIKADSKSDQAFVFAGDAALAAGQVGTACGYYEQAILFNPDCYDAYYKYARAYVGVNPQLSIDMLMKLKAAHPELADVNRELANAYYQKGDNSKAKAAYDDFMSVGTPTTSDYERYAMLLYLNKDYQQSLATVEKGLTDAPDSHLLKRLKMYDTYELKDYAAGLAAAEAFFSDANNPNYVYLDYMYRGRIYLQSDKADLAMEQFNKALEMDTKKEHPEIAKEMSEAYEKLHNYPEAIRTYQSFLDQLGDKAEVSDQFLLGRLYYMAASEAQDSTKAGFLQQADTVFAQVAEKVPDNYLGYFWRARTNAMSDPETTQGLAKPYYEKALEILKANPNSSKSVLIECESYLGYYYFLQKDYEQSKQYWNEILTIDPENATAKQALEGLK